MVLSKNQTQILGDIRMLSSGTLCVLTGGISLYSRLDVIRSKWLDFLHYSFLQGVEFNSWVDAWWGFRSNKEFYNV